MSKLTAFSRLVAIIRSSSRLTFFVLATTSVHGGDTPTDGVRIEPGKGTFTFVDSKGDASRRMTVYTYLPAKLKADAATIVFVMHGQGKNAEAARGAAPPGVEAPADQAAVAQQRGP